MTRADQQALPIDGELSLSVERGSGFDCVCVGIQSAAGVERINAQRESCGGLLVKLAGAVAVGSPVMVRFSSPGQPPLEVLGCVVYELPTGAVIKLDMSASSAKGCWEAIERSWKSAASRPATRRATPPPPDLVAPPQEPFEVASSGLKAHLDADSTRAVLTLSTSNEGVVRAFARALYKGRTIKTPPGQASISCGELEVRVISPGVQNQVRFSTRVLCALPRGGMIVDPGGSRVAATEALERLIEAMEKVKGDPLDSGAVLKPHGPPQTRGKNSPRHEHARTSPPQDPAVTPQPPVKPEILLDPAARAAAPRPLEIKQAPRAERVDPRVLALRRERDALSALSPYEILRCHWSSYQAVIEASHAEIRARHKEQAFPPELQPAAGEAVEAIIEVIDGALKALSDHKKRLVWRFKNISDDQIQTAVAHYLEQGKMYAWRRDHEKARDSFLRVVEIDPINEEVRKRFKARE